MSQSPSSSEAEPSIELSPDYGRNKSKKEHSVESSPKKRPEVRVNHSIHDRLQVESNFTFDLRPRFSDEHRRDFKVDFYLFIPNAVGVNKSNFGSGDFFRHITNHFRVRAPLYQHLRKMDPEELSFESAEKYFSDKMSAVERDKLIGRLVQDVKLFGNFLHTELKKLRSKLASKKKRSTERQRGELARALLHRAELLWAFRKRYLEPIRAEERLVDDEVVRAFCLTDEYLSYRIELVLLRAIDLLKTRRAELKDCLQREIAYRQENGLLVLGEREQDTVGLEAYTYRLGLLKKYMGECLYIQLASNKKDKLYRNYAAAVGAGLAATVAGLAEHQRVQYLTGNDSGLRLAFLIGVAVLAYIFKDRVKDLSKEYFNSRFKEKLPDQSFQLSHTSYTGKGHKKIRQLGTVSEYIRFLKEVPPDVAYLRTLGQVKASDPKRHEHVLHMGRRLNLELRSKKHRKLFPLLKNVLRLDISPFLSKLDNPTMPISFVGEKGKAQTVQAPKVYHLNAVLRYEAKFDDEDGTRFVDYERYRVIVNKNGIVRLEQVVDQGRLAYEEQTA